MDHVHPEVGPVVPTINPQRSMPRLAIAAIAGALVGLVLIGFPWVVWAVAGGTLSVVEIVLGWRLIARGSAAETRQFGEGPDPGRTAVSFFLVGASL